MLAGVHASRLLSRESICLLDRSADVVAHVGKQHRVCRHRKARLGSARSEKPSTHGNFLNRNWEIPCSALHGDGGKIPHSARPLCDSEHLFVSCQALVDLFDAGVQERGGALFLSDGVDLRGVAALDRKVSQFVGHCD